MKIPGFARWPKWLLPVILLLVLGVVLRFVNINAPPLDFHSNTYSVPSRLVRYQVTARLYAERVEIRFAGQCVMEAERLRGEEKAQIDYSHIVGSLVAAFNHPDHGSGGRDKPSPGQFRRRR